MEHQDLTFCRNALKSASPSRVASASGFSKRWLEYIRDGHIDNPGIQRIAELRRLIEDRPDLFADAGSTPTESAA